ncbi:bacteriophage Mu Gp45 family protein [Paraburkholderia xenovorans LB400]|uniref:Baseplate assembly protein Gp45,Mu-like protein n=2 Tax=Paraburkholderia xenovorans TaxID=36873 RepID=Q141Q9_PARXL|nr:Putative baseplate assembly protein Gp45,Mu-like protein [Paraburkholderia xenovorans LB400]AIP33037.1 bacteriophage Mu Gp45 family protein [Paraburkholderia xenovorans LB400]
MSALAQGLVKLVNDSAGIQFMQVKFNPLQTIDNLPRCAEYGLTSNPPEDSDAVVAFAGGDRSNGVVIATGNAKYRMRQLSTGEVAIHDNIGQSVYLTAEGIVINGGGNPLTVTNTPKVRMETALMECTGDIVDNCDTNGRSMAADRVIFDGHEHDVKNVQGGSSTITSEKPTQQE